MNPQIKFCLTEFLFCCHYFSNKLKLQIEKKTAHSSTFQYIEDISIVFLGRIWRQSVRKKFRHK